MAPFGNSDPVRTKWTSGGLDRKKQEDVKLLAGRDYVVIEPDDEDDYFTFPAEPASVFGVLRHSWVVIRRRVPYVPVLKGVALPSGAKQREDNARYFSVFFRPWTLCASNDVHIPHLATLGYTYMPTLLPLQRKRLRTRSKTKPSTVSEIHSFAKSWSAYLKEGVVSEHAARLITSVLVNTMGRGNTEQEQEGDTADKSDIDDEIPPLQLSAEDFRAIMNRSRVDTRSDTRTSTEEVSTVPKAPAPKKQSRRKTDHQHALHLIDSLWATRGVSSSDAPRAQRGPMHMSRARDHLSARNASKEANTHGARPYAQKLLPSASLHVPREDVLLREWLRELQTREVKPTKEQEAFLQTVVERLIFEAYEEQADRVGRTPDNEPMFDMIHGVPGAS